MKKFVIIALGLLTATAITTSAAEGKKKELTEDQKKAQKELLEKFDTNKNGKLDADEVAKMSEDDKKKAKEAGLSTGGGKKKDK
jgi:flagellar basal body-associated protein FliL